MRISDWSSDVCSSDLSITVVTEQLIRDQAMQGIGDVVRYVPGIGIAQGEGNRDAPIFRGNSSTADFFVDGVRDDLQYFRDRSEEHTSELQSLMRISYAVFCLIKTNITLSQTNN